MNTTESPENHEPIPLLGLGSSDGLGAGSEARKEWREAGACTNCDTPVTLVHNSDHATCRMDRRRYVDARFPDRGWCLFRCNACHAVIDKNWAASEAPNVLVTWTQRPARADE